eukprot:365001-Chlamydomonas_euryale.AAC.1
MWRVRCAQGGAVHDAHGRRRRADPLDGRRSGDAASSATPQPAHASSVGVAQACSARQTHTCSGRCARSHGLPRSGSKRTACWRGAAGRAGRTGKHRNAVRVVDVEGHAAVRLAGLAAPADRREESVERRRRRARRLVVVVVVKRGRDRPHLQRREDNLGAPLKHVGLLPAQLLSACESGGTWGGGAEKGGEEGG